MKKIVTTLFLISILYQQIGYLLVFKIQQWQIHETVEEMIKTSVNDADLEIIEINENVNVKSIFTYVKKHEIEYNNHRYDIIRTKKLAHSTLYYLFDDKAEKQLYQTLAKKVEEENSSNTGSDKQTSIKVIKDYVLNDQIKLLILDSKLSAYTFFTLQKSPSVLFEVKGPPPRLA